MLMYLVQKAISKQLKAQKPKPPLCHTLPASYTSVSAAAGIIECIFDELQVLSLSRVILSQALKILCFWLSSVTIKPLYLKFLLNPRNIGAVYCLLLKFF